MSPRFAQVGQVPQQPGKVGAPPKPRVAENLQMAANAGTMPQRVFHQKNNILMQDQRNPSRPNKYFMN